MTNKEKYRQLCLTETTINIFSQDWWLDAVIGDSNWDVSIVEKNGSIIGAIPYHHKTKLGFSIITVPPFTRYSGLWLKYPANQKLVSKLSFEQKVINELIEKLPAFSDLTINIASIYTNWKPFYFKGFKQTSYYSYTQTGPIDLDAVWKNMDDGMRGILRKAEKKLSIKESHEIEDLLVQFESIQKRNNFTTKNSSEIIPRLFHKCQQKNCGKILYAILDDTPIASLLIVWDNTSIYTLVSGSNPQFNKWGGLSLLYWEALKTAAKMQLSFDFMGTMLENVDPHLRDFGLDQKPYSIISKSNHWLFKLKRTFS